MQTLIVLIESTPLVYFLRNDNSHCCVTKATKTESAHRERRIYGSRPAGRDTANVESTDPGRNSRKSESFPKNTHGKTEYMTNHADSSDILTNQAKIEKVTGLKYLGQITHLNDTTKEDIYAKIRAAWSCFGKKKPKEILQDRQLPISLQKQVMDQCALPTMTYGCQAWPLNKQLTNKLRTAQTAMERKMLGLKLQD